MPENKLSYLLPGEARYTGKADAFVRFTMAHQLLDANTWKNFVEVFRHDSDDFDLGWRGEYFGKMMRGACLVYSYNGDEGLYRVLEDCILDMLSAQREDGRFSTYSVKAGLNGWDLWSRKYVLTGMMHFYRIAKSEDVKKKILAALVRHADVILATVGDGEGKISIVKASTHWLGVNSASILEPMVDLYKLTGEKRFLDFAGYIVGTGGCDGENLIGLALEGKKMPFEYPEVKAYETISFFEGVLAYYEVTGEKKYFEAVKKFIEAVAATDITVIGCAGCTHELFDHSAVRQIEYSDIIMQETCVTVTWMRVLARLHLLTGEKVYMDRMETAAYNALYGAVNDRMLKQYSILDKEWFDPLPFDSYSPLYNNKRGRGIGGFKRFAFGGYYGCCACIAAAGIGLFPLSGAVREEGAIRLEVLHSGEIVTEVAGAKITLKIDTEYPVSMKTRIRVLAEGGAKVKLKIRVPDFCEAFAASVSGKIEDGYFLPSCALPDGEEITLAGGFSLKAVKVGRRTAFTYGPLVLARDAAKEAGKVDLEEEIAVAARKGAPVYRSEAPDRKTGETLRIYLGLQNGGEMLLTDYASCGKGWDKENCRMSVFLNVKGL